MSEGVKVGLVTSFGNSDNEYLKQIWQMLVSMRNGSFPIHVSGGGGGGIQSIVAGSNINVDNTDPENPVLSLAFPLVFNSTGQSLIQNNDKAFLSSDLSGNPFLSNQAQNATLGFDAFGGVVALGSNVQANGTVTPVTSITTTGGFQNNIS